MTTFGDEDAIQIEQLELSVRIGVPEEERATAQRLTVSLTMVPLAGFQKLDDAIANAVDYARVCREVTAFVAQRSDRLIETLANALAAHLLRTFPLKRIRLELRKFVLPDVKHVAVIVTRERAREMGS